MDPKGDSERGRERKKDDSAIEVWRCRYKCKGVGGRAAAAAIKVSWM